MNAPELRDIHLPAEPSWWPPAPGWWLLLVIGVTVVALFLYWRRRRRRTTMKRSLARELEVIRSDYQRGDADARVAVNAVARLLRRTLIGYRGRRQGAASTGDAWRKQLLQLTPEQVFSDEQLQWLARGRYRHGADGDVESLLRACKDWIDQLPREGRHAAD